MRIWALAFLACIAIAEFAKAASNEVQYGPPPSWIEPAPTTTSTAAAEGAAARVIYFDWETRVGPTGTEYYTAYRIKLLKPEALSVGNLNAAWNPATDTFTVHSLKIIRDGHEVDVLAKNKFRVVEREGNLEYAVLDGTLTATLQVPGLQVGDEIEFAATLNQRDPIFDGKAAGGTQLPLVGSPGAFRARVLWPNALPLHWQATPDLARPEVRSLGSEQELTEVLLDPASAVMTDGAPPRFNVRRLLEFSQFSSWGEISDLYWPLFQRASTLSPSSPLRAEAAKIAASAPTPAARAEAALEFVQDKIRYVYVGLGGGAYQPAVADDTWTRRFGDCKAKTVVLIALLRELGIQSEPVLVNSDGGDGVDQRLPTLSVFNHVLVRAHIDGKDYWLDGTRLGDQRLAALPPPSSRWGLVLTPGTTKLEAIAPQAPILPQVEVLLEIDATAGFDAAARIRTEEVLRGDGVLALRENLAAQTPQDADRAVTSFFQQVDPWVQADSTSWRYDDIHDSLVLDMTGSGKPDWTGDDENGHNLAILGAGFTPPNELHRPKEQDQTAPWQTDFPAFHRWTTVIRLPSPRKDWRWTYTADPVDERLGGAVYWRTAQLANGVMVTTMSRRVFEPEISTQEAEEIGERLPKFDNRISEIYEATAESGPDADPTDPKGELEAAQRLRADQRLEDAAKYYDRALVQHPGWPPALLGKAQLRTQEGDFAAALQLIDKVQLAAPKGDFRLLRAEVLIGLGRTDEALKLLDEVAAGAAGDRTTLLRVASMEVVAAHAYDRARSTVEQGLKLSPGDSQFLQIRAYLDEQDNRLDEALADADEAVRARPESLTGLLTRSQVLSKLNRLDDALADLEEAWRLDPLNPDVANARANVLEKLGRSAEAMSVYDDWIAIDPSATALNARCWKRAKVNTDIAKAESDCAAALKLEPTWAGIWDSFALVAFRQDRFPDALARYNHALALSARLAPSLYGRGVTKIRLGDAAGGKADIAAALAIRADAGDELNAAGVRP